MSSRDQIAYERFQQLVEIPMLVLSLAFVPIIAAPLVVELSASTDAAIAAFFIEESSGELDEVRERLRRIEELLARQAVPLSDQPSSDLASAGDGER